MSTVPEVRVGDHGRRPLLVFGAFPVFQRHRPMWSHEDRERARWVRDANRVRGLDGSNADYVVLEGYSNDQSQAIVVAKRRGLVQLWPSELMNGDGSFRTFEPTEALEKVQKP